MTSHLSQLDTLTEALSGRHVEELSLLASGPAVAIVRSGLKGAGGTVSLGGSGARLTGRVACWGKRRSEGGKCFVSFFPPIPDFPHPKSNFGYQTLPHVGLEGGCKTFVLSSSVEKIFLSR